MSSNLADYFRAQAEWRERKAEQHPEDERNAQSAAALRYLAEYVEPIDSLDTESPSGEHYLSYVVPLEAHLLEGSVLGGDRARRAVSRYGFDQPGATGKGNELFLGELVELCVEDAYDFVVEHGEDPTATLHPFEVDAARDGVQLQRGYWRARDRSTVAEREQLVQDARASEPVEGGGA